MLDLFKWFLAGMILACTICAIYLDYSAIQRESRKKQQELIEEMMEKQFRDRLRIRELWGERNFWIKEANRLKRG